MKMNEKMKNKTTTCTAHTHTHTRVHEHVNYRVFDVSWFVNNGQFNGNAPVLMIIKPPNDLSMSDVPNT